MAAKVVDKRAGRGTARKGHPVGLRAAQGGRRVVEVDVLVPVVRAVDAAALELRATHESIDKWSIDRTYHSVKNF